MSASPDPRLGAVLDLVAAYVRGERTDDELLGAVRADPDLAPLEASCLRCGSLAQELLEALERSPFDDDLPWSRPPSPTREGVARWLDRVRSGEQEAVALCDWATDAFAWQDPTDPMDAVVEEVLSGIMGSEDDVVALVGDDARLELARWHLERTPPDRAAAAALGAAVLERRDELLVAIVTRSSGASDDDEVRAEVERWLGPCRRALPTVVDDVVAAARRLAETGAGLEEVERFLDRLARTGDAFENVR